MCISNQIQATLMQSERLGLWSMKNAMVMQRTKAGTDGEWIVRQGDDRREGARMGGRAEQDSTRASAELMLELARSIALLLSIAATGIAIAAERAMAMAGSRATWLLLHGGWRPWMAQRCGKSTLAYEEVVVQGTGTGKVKTAMVVHGLMGSGRNWRTVSKRLATAIVDSAPGASGWRMIMIDLRNHGHSASLSNLKLPHDIPAAARDVADLIQGEGWDAPDAMIAHSLGGKVVLEFAQKAATGSYGAVKPPKQLWVLDSVPGEVPMENSDGEVERVLAVLKSLPKPIPSRRWLADYFVEKGFSKGLADWLGSNLKRASTTTEEMDWIFNVDGAYEMFASYRKTDYWSVLEQPPKGMHIEIVRAAKSDRWTPDILARMKEAEAKKPDNVSFHVLENAGHWLHTDNPSGLIAIMAPILAKISQ